jgi:hypothetical protein
MQCQTLCAASPWLKRLCWIVPEAIAGERPSVNCRSTISPQLIESKSEKMTSNLSRTLNTDPCGQNCLAGRKRDTLAASLPGISRAVNGQQPCESGLITDHVWTAGLAGQAPAALPGASWLKWQS